MTQQPRRAVTFDFHATLALSDPWFQLETTGLVEAILRWRADQSGAPVSADRLAAARAAYRRLRRGIIDHGHELSAERCAAVVLDELGVHVPDSEIERGIDILMRQVFLTVEPVPGAVETVRALSAQGLPLAVISNAVYHPFLEWTLTQFGIIDAFNIITTSASAGFYKSRPEIYTNTLAHLGANPKCSVHIGDSFRFDIEAARRAGMKTAWLRHNAHPQARHPSANPADLTLTSLTNAAPHIINLLR